MVSRDDKKTGASSSGKMVAAQGLQRIATINQQDEISFCFDSKGSLFLPLLVSERSKIDGVVKPLQKSVHIRRGD